MSGQPHRQPLLELAAWLAKLAQEESSRPASWRKFQVRYASPPKIFAGHRRHGVRSC